MKRKPLTYNCLVHGLDADCKCANSGYAEVNKKRRRDNELCRLRRKLRSLTSAPPSGASEDEEGR